MKIFTLTFFIICHGSLVALAEAPAKSGDNPKIKTASLTIAVADIQNMKLHPYDASIDFAYAGNVYTIYNAAPTYSGAGWNSDPNLLTELHLLSGMGLLSEIQHASQLSFDAQSLPGKDHQWVVRAQKLVLYFNAVNARSPK